MVARMRIYYSNGPISESDQIFYEQVKPVHEKHGAKFIGRYINEQGNYIVLWEYESELEMSRIQEAVANDPETLATKDIRLKSGLHAVPFKEYLLKSTDQIYNVPKGQWHKD